MNLANNWSDFPEERNIKLVKQKLVTHFSVLL